MDAAAAGCALIGASAATAFLAAVPRRDRVTPAQAMLAGYSAGQQEPPPPRQVPRWPRALAQWLSRPGVRVSLQRRLDLAGNPAGWSPDRMLAVKGLAMLTGAATGIAYGLHSPALAALGAVAGGAAGLFLPDLLLYNATSKRRVKIAAALPDAVDLLTICVQAGLNFDGALGHVAAGITGPLGAEVSRVLREIQIGRSRGQALRDMAVRSAVPELRSFTSALIQAGELGIPVAAVLREQSARMRAVRRQRAEAQAQKIAVKILFPLLFCLFPALFVFVIGPGVLSLTATLSGR